MDKKYTEKLICKKCKNITFRPAEIEELKLDTDSSIFAVIVNKYQCQKCKSKDFSSILIDNYITEQDEKIVQIG